MINGPKNIGCKPSMTRATTAPGNRIAPIITVGQNARSTSAAIRSMFSYSRSMRSLPLLDGPSIVRTSGRAQGAKPPPLVRHGGLRARGRTSGPDIRT
jgi:hypothetical protein